MTDLDTPRECPPGLIRSWIRGTLNPRLLFRVAVMEVESWVMADRMGFADFLSVPSHRILSPTDNILNPKEFLLSLARRSKKKAVREALVPAQGATLSVGNQYNTLLSEFVQDHWNLERAATASPSLKRTLDRLAQEKKRRYWFVNKKFQRYIEDFTCAHCGAAVEGNGYTNHCPECLWSRHVDVNPGDRSASCQGMMEPVGFTVKHGNYILTHRCATCGIEKKNKTSKNDNFEAILSLQGELNV